MPMRVWSEPSPLQQRLHYRYTVTRHKHRALAIICRVLQIIIVLVATKLQPVEECLARARARDTSGRRRRGVRAAQPDVQSPDSCLHAQKHYLYTREINNEWMIYGSNRCRT